MFRKGGARGRCALAAALAVGASGLTVAAAAASAYDTTLPTPGGSGLPQSSVSNQYVEVVPNGGTSARSHSQTLSPTLRQEIRRRGGKDAALLLAIAASPNYGAPPTLARSDTASAAGAASSSSAVDAAVSAASGDERHVIGLAVAMLVITLWLVAATAVRQARRERRATDVALEHGRRS